MGVLVTINNEYDNGVCESHVIYTGTTYNIDNAVSIGTHILPYTWDVGSFRGNLFVFVEHCDSHLNPPPSINPKQQGGFQVRLLTIDCETCPPMTPPNPIDCNMIIDVTEMFMDCIMRISVTELNDCDMEIDVVEFSDCDMTISVAELIDCDMTISVAELIDCDMDISVEELI